MMFDRLSLLPGTLLLPLRLVLGWTYFSAFWRRLVLENKLIPDQAGYIGEKFNHFLPNALFIGDAIEFFVSHPTLLWWKLLLFTLVEAVVGAALIFGVATRVAGAATAMLAGGILLGAGWLGTTCLDEWQIGTLGIASGLLVAITGGGRFSLDHWAARKWPLLGSTAAFRWITALQPSVKFSGLLSISAAVIALGLTLFTNQVFHGGLWGKLHNLSVRPKVEVSHVALKDESLSVQLYRVEGADVYGSFAIALRVLDSNGEEVVVWQAEGFRNAATISNHYVAKVEAGPHALILPLGAKADITLTHPALASLRSGTYSVELLDISGLKWSAPLVIL